MGYSGSYEVVLREETRGCTVRSDRHVLLELE